MVRKMGRKRYSKERENAFIKLEKKENLFLQTAFLST